MIHAQPLALGLTLLFGGVDLCRCGGSSGSAGGGVRCSSISPDAAVTLGASACYPDSDATNGGSYTIEIVVDDTGFLAAGPDAGAKNLLSTENDAMVTLTLTNMGTTPHGFAVGCVNVCPAYPNLPAGCPPTACFPPNSSIAPLAPGASVTISFDTPTPDGLIYPFNSNEPSDTAVPGLNDGQWTLM